MTSASHATPSQSTSTNPSWSARYGARHQLERITDFPRGVIPPRKVRLYWRLDHYVLQWWDPGQKRTLSDRVDGDLVAALTRVREIDDRLDERGRVPTPKRRLSFGDFIARFLAYARQRANAEEIDVRTVNRYRTALAYLEKFTAQPAITAQYPHPGRADREFVLGFQAFLQQQLITRSGKTRPLAGLEFLLATARLAYSWAADPDGAALLAPDFRNPFHGRNWTIRRPAPDPTTEPPITVDMAVDWLKVCDDFQRRLFIPLMLFGLRATEVCWVFAEDVSPDWFSVRCQPELRYLTKGQRDKKFPLVTEIRPFLASPATAGLWICRRAWEPTAGIRHTRAQLIDEFQRRLATEQMTDAAGRRRLRTELLRAHGALDYDGIEREFRTISQKLGWPSTATLKGFRHLFATALENSRCPHSFRQYFLGHSQERAAIVRYTHLDELARHYGELLHTSYAPIIATLQCLPVPGGKQAA